MSELPPRKHRLAEMTFREFEQRLPEKPVIVLALGSQEEQGPACPMGDYMLTEIIADRVAEASGAIVAPVIPFGYADYFRPVPGGVSLRPETFMALLEDMIVSFLDHDLDKILILNGHTGNAPLIDVTVRKMKMSRGVLVPTMHLWRSIPESLYKSLYGDDLPRAKGHGADPLTSVYSHLRPELMRPDLAEGPGPYGNLLGLPTAGLDAVRFEEVNVSLAVDVTDHCQNGITGGDPSVCTAENGAAIVEHLVGLASRFVAHLKDTDTTTDP